MTELPAIVKVLPPAVKVPLVRARVLATVVALPKVTPPAPLMVKLLTLALKVEARKHKRTGVGEGNRSTGVAGIDTATRSGDRTTGNR